MLEALPKVAAEVAAPLTQAQKIKMVSAGSGEIGVAKLTREVLSVVGEVPKMITQMTGVDIRKGAVA